MEGIVEITRGGKVILSESNLITDQMSELTVDILTANPSLSAIPSASAILDASNYTVQALTFGKGSQDYRNHAHHINVSAGAINVVSTCIAAISASSYATCSYDGHLLDLKNPSYPNSTDTRLERHNTQTPIGDLVVDPNIAAVSALNMDLGHMLNAIHTSASNGLGLSSVMVGCFPASADGGTGGTYYRLLDKSGTEVSAGTFISRYNYYHVMDSSGFLHMTVANAQEGNNAEDISTNAGNSYSGLIVVADDFGHFSGTVATPPHGVKYQTLVSAGDLGGAAMYGGIWSLGLWSLDMKTLLAEGKNPPYAFDSLNNQRKYKLLSKKVFTKPITYHQDTMTGDGGHPCGGLASFEEGNNLAGGLGHEILNSVGIIWTLKL